MWQDILAAPVFVINLDECTERMRISEKRIREAGYRDIRRIAGIDAKTADLKTEWAKYGSPAFSKTDAEFVTFPGKQACVLSWLKTLRTIIDEGIAYATVFEDDIMFHKDWAKLAPEYYKATPTDYELCYLGSQINNPLMTSEISRAPAFCTHAILLSLAGAQKLYNFILNHPKGIYTIDCMMYEMGFWPLEAHPYVFYVWNSLKFEDPARFMPKDWTKRNCGLVYQDYDAGSLIQPY